MHMGIGSNSILPEGPRKFGLIEQCKCMLYDSVISAFSNTILMRFSTDSMLSPDACIITKGLPLIGHVFASLVIAQYLNSASKLIFS